MIGLFIFKKNNFIIHSGDLRTYLANIAVVPYKKIKPIFINYFDIKFFFLIDRAQVLNFIIFCNIYYREGQFLLHCDAFKVDNC